MDERLLRAQGSGTSNYEESFAVEAGDAAPFKKDAH